MAVAISGSVNFGSPVYSVLYTCLGFLALKVLLMVFLIGRYRFTKGVVCSPEDKVFGNNFKVKYNDPDVERMRRAHRNDLENIIPFASLACWYAALNPSPFIAIPLFLLFTIARYGHTYVYAIKVTKQPARAICFMTGLLISIYMGICIILSLTDSM